MVNKFFWICYVFITKKWPNVNKSLTATGGLVFEARVDCKASTESVGDLQLNANHFLVICYLLLQKKNVNKCEQSDFPN